ncbi:MAG: Fic family protein [Pseudomonadales bacterium]
MGSPRLYLARSAKERDALAYRSRKGELRRLAPRVYIAADVDNIDALLRAQLAPLLEFLYPGHVLAYRNALSLLPESSHVYLITPKPNARNVRVGPLTMHLLPGAVDTGTEQVLPRLKRMTEARVLLESEAGQKARRGREKFLRPDEIEAILVKRLAQGKERGLNALRDEARACADAFGQADAFAALNAKISALLATGDAGGVLHSSAGHAHAAREPFDGACLARCERFAEYLQRQFFAPLPFVYERSAWRNLAFFEAYFSNYIEGTEMTVEEAQQVVFEHRDLAQRSGDSHDVRGSWEICADLEEMSHVPQDASAFLSLLRSRHKVLLRGRPATRPGEFKHTANRAGNTPFVAPECVAGTLTRGFEICQAAAPGFTRALLLHFLITDVHPMQDGNGRLAHVLMNAELVATGQHKIIVPNVAREDYLNGQRRASRAGDFRTATKVLYQLHHYTAALPATLYDELLERLERDGAFSTPDEGVATFNAVRRAHRYDER